MARLNGKNLVGGLPCSTVKSYARARQLCEQSPSFARAKGARNHSIDEFCMLW